MRCIFFGRDRATGHRSSTLVTAREKILEQIDPLPFREELGAFGCGDVRGVFDSLMIVDVAGTVHEHVLDSTPDHQRGTGKLTNRGLVAVNRGRRVDANTVWCFEVDEQQTNLPGRSNVSRRQEHAVPVVHRKHDGDLVFNLGEPNRASLVGDARPTVDVNSAEEEEVARLDELPLIFGDQVLDYYRLVNVSQSARIELVLE